MSWFGFKSGDQQKKVGVLSGGERNRVQLAKILRSGGNVMVLDEPTNDLDVDTLRSLEVRQSVGWLVGRLVGWLFVWLVGRLVGWLVGWF